MRAVLAVFLPLAGACGRAASPPSGAPLDPPPSPAPLVRAEELQTGKLRLLPAPMPKPGSYDPNRRR